MASDFDKLWAEAHATFLATTKRQLDDRSLPVITTLDDLKLEITKQQASFSEFREKRNAIFGALSKALGPLQLLTSIAAAGINNAYPPSGSAFSAFNYLLSAAGSVSAAYDSIQDLLEELAHFTSRLSIHSEQDISPQLRGIVIQILCALIRICAYAGRLMKHGRVSEYFRKLVLTKDKDIAAEFEKLQRLTEAEARMVGALTLSTTTRTEKQLESAVGALSQANAGIHDVSVDIAGLRDQMSGLNLMIGELRAEDRNPLEQKHLVKIRQTLQPVVTCEEIHRAIIGKRVSGTGDWLHDERLFKAWRARDMPLLWIAGGPGAGKSYLSSSIIQLLTKQHAQGGQAASRVSVAFYFCKDYDPDLRSFNKALRTVAFQICQNDPVFAKYVAGICSFPEDIRTTESLWQKLFVDYFNDINTDSVAYILIDGIDEALEAERSTFLELLRGVRQGSPLEKSRISVSMVGRPEVTYDIERVLEGSLPTIFISATKNSADIKHYVSTKVAKERNLRRISKALHTEIVTELTSKADGMFLWVDLMLKEVASKHKEAQMRQALHEAPKGLFDTIQHALDRMHHDLSEDDARDFDTLLSWTACAKRPFKLGELEDILKLTSSDGESVIYLEGELRKRFASFFNVNREDGRSTEDLHIEYLEALRSEEHLADGEDQDSVTVFDHDEGTADDFGEDMDIESSPTTTEVTLAHASFGDFFRMHHSAEAKTTDHSMWSLRIVKQLLTMLCEKDVFDKWSQQSLSKYAAVYWQDHLCEVDFDKTDYQDRVEIARRLTSMFNSEETLIAWSNLAIDANMFRQNWVFTDTNISNIQKWLSAVPPELIGSSVSNILQTTIECLAKMWLDGRHKITYPGGNFLIVKAYQDKIEALDKNDTTPKITDLAASNIANNSVEEILKVARQFGFEENSHWNNRVGRTLQSAGHYQAGKIYLQKAIDLAGPNEQQCLSMLNLGALFADEEDYAQAIAMVEKGLEAAELDPFMPAEEKVSTNKYWTLELIRWHEKLKKAEHGVRLCQEMLKRYPKQYGVMTSYVSMLGMLERYEEAMSFLRELSEEACEEEEYTRLTDWCIYATKHDYDDTVTFYDVLVRSCRETGNIDFARTTHVDALKAVKKSDSDATALLEASFASLLLREYRDADRSIRILEHALDSVKASKKASVSSFAKVRIVELLCEIYLSKALKGGKNSPEAASAIEKISNLWTSLSIVEDPWDESYGSDGFSSTRSSTLCLASLYRKFDEPEKARPLLREHVKLGLDFLTDDEPGNDWQGYFKLADTLSRAGDSVNAQAAYALVTFRWLPTDMDGNTVTQVLYGDYGESSCCGECGIYEARGAEGMYNCLFCTNTCFEQNCYNLLMEDKLKFNLCGKDHEFFYTPPVEPFFKGHVPVDGKLIPEKDWLTGIRKEWNL